MTTHPTNQPHSPTSEEHHEGKPSKWPLPYYAVIFTSRRRPPLSAGDSSMDTSPTTKDADYSTTATAMLALAQQQPGYLGVESYHMVSQNGFVTGVTISYWTDTASIRAWRAVREHAEARRRGKAEWYSGWNVRVAKVEREYGSRDGCGELEGW